MKSICLLVSIVSVGLFQSLAFGATPHQQGYVNDFANVVNDNDEQELEEQLQRLENDTKIEFVVVTVESLEGDHVATFTKDLANNWNVGQRGHQKGIVLLVAPNKRKVTFQIADRVHPDIDEHTADIIADTITPLFREGRVSDSVVSGAREMKNVIREIYGKPRDMSPSETLVETDNSRSTLYQGLPHEPINIPWGKLFKVGVPLLAIGLAALGLFLALRQRRINIELRAQIPDLQTKIPLRIPELRSQASHPDVPQALRDELDRLSGEFQNEGEHEPSSQMTSVQLRDLHSKLQRIERNIDSLEQKIADAKATAVKAREESPELIELLSRLLQDAEADLQDDRVTPERAEKYAAISERYQEVVMAAPKTPQGDWVETYTTLQELQGELSQLRQKIAGDKSVTDMAKRQSPQLLATLQEEVKRLEARGSGVYESKVTEARRNLDEAVKASERVTSPWQWQLVYKLIEQSQAAAKAAPMPVRRSAPRSTSSSSSSRRSGGMGGFGGRGSSGSMGGGSRRSGGFSGRGSSGSM